MLIKSLIITLLTIGVAGNKGASIDELGVETRASFHQQVEDGVYGSQFVGEYLNLKLAGHITDNLSFNIRQRFNKKITSDNPFNATDFLYLKWDATPKFSFTAGKQALLIGGYEIDSAPIDVYYYGAFSNNLNHYYAFSASATYSPVKGQDLSFQFAPSPIAPIALNRYSYNLYWNGAFSSWWKTIWSANLVEDSYGRKMNWLVLGNKFVFDDFFIDIDLINRASAAQRQFFFSDCTFITKAIWTLGKWNLCAKFGYEFNDPSNVDNLGLSYDLVIPAGHTFFYGGAGVEYFPLADERLRLHAVVFRNDHDHITNFDLGLTWRINFVKRQE